MPQPKVTPWSPSKGVPMWTPTPPLNTPHLDAVLDGCYGDMANKWCKSLITPSYHEHLPGYYPALVDKFDWGGVPVSVIRTLGIRNVKEQIWRWYREQGCSDAVVELVFLIYNHDSFNYYIKHICEYICGGKWMVQNVPYTQKVVDRLESCATTIRNQLYNIIKNELAKKHIQLIDDWQIQHVPMKLVDVLPTFQANK